MKKRIAFRKLGRTSSHRWAMLRNMVTSLIKHECIHTTIHKARELQYVVDKVIGYARKGSLHHRRLAGRIVREKKELVKLFEILGPRYYDREGGYTRLLKLSKPRNGDNSAMAIIEFVDRRGEIRKARPPLKRKNLFLSRLTDVLAKVGINNPNRD